MSFVLEILIFVSIVYVIYRCCLRGRGPQHSGNDTEGSPNQEGQSTNTNARIGVTGVIRNGAVTVDTTTGNVVPLARDLGKRTELIEKNLFSRKIGRKESVKELLQVLAVSRGFTVMGLDEETGLRNGNSHCDPADCVAPPKDSNVGNSSTLDEPTLAFESIALEESPSAPTAEIDPVPTAPSPPTLMHSHIANTARLSSTETTSEGSGRTRAIRNIWTNWIQPKSDIPTDVVKKNHQNDVCKPLSRRMTVGSHFVCAICLEDFVPDDTISWAKDSIDLVSGGSSANAMDSSVGCDHIFHQECLMTWLHNHDDCPLCRRKMVHADAEKRFMGWERVRNE